MATSIPLSILTSIVALGALNQTLNVMTLGGLALAVGILVDDATVEIENIHRNMGMGKSLQRAILDGASQIASPTFVSTLAICIVFVSVVFLTGPARYLFTPMALAVVFAMLASYLLSRTVVPLMAKLMLGSEVDRYREEHSHDLLPEEVAHAHEDGPGSAAATTPMSRGTHAHEDGPPPSFVLSEVERLPVVRPNGHGSGDQVGIGKPGRGQDGSGQETERLSACGEDGRRPNGNGRVGLGAGVGLLRRAVAWFEGVLWAVHGRFNLAFERMRASYVDSLEWALHHRRHVCSLFGAFFVVSACLVPFVGRDFFPSVDAGQLRLHVRAPAGTRVEETDRIFHDVAMAIREIIPPQEVSRVVSNIGLPISGLNYVLSDTATVGPNDGEILISLTAEHGSTEDYVHRLRETLGARFPQLGFFFQPADIVNQILNFGLPAPLDIQVVGRDAGNLALARELAAKVRLVPGAVDVHLHQVVDQPELHVDVNRSRAQDVGLTQRDVANNLLVSLSSSGQAAPSYWLDPRTGVSYLVSVQTPQYKMNSVDELMNTSLVPSSGGGQRTQTLANLATVSRGRAAAVVSHYNVQPVYDVYANVQGRDLGGVASDVGAIMQAVQAKMPPGNRLVLRGQVQSMNSSFLGLGTGVIFAILLVYLLMVVNFQSWIDPFIIIMALPGALCGIIWILFVTQTTFSVPSLMGTIMCIGVATANSILLVTFANERRGLGDTAIASALAAGFTRLRPVLMTAAAMIIGMLPMSLGLGEGGEQNAPLGRAVIGGLLVATFTTLYLVPVVYSWMRRHHVPHVDRDDEVTTWSKEQERVGARTPIPAVANTPSGG